jgi:hypothetical protein
MRIHAQNKHPAQGENLARRPKINAADEIVDFVGMQARSLLTPEKREGRVSINCLRKQRANGRKREKKKKKRKEKKKKLLMNNARTTMVSAKRTSLAVTIPSRSPSKA